MNKIKHQIINKVMRISITKYFIIEVNIKSIIIFFFIVVITF